jgi:hypothetical protein
VQLRLKELAMPDLDQIKQVEQECEIGAGGSSRAGQAIPPAGPRLPRERFPLLFHERRGFYHCH